MTDSIILLGPIEVEAGTDPECVDDTTHFTDPILGGTMPSTAGAKMPGGPSGTNVFNLYNINLSGTAGSLGDYAGVGVRTGSIKFGVTPCAEKIEFDIVGRADDFSPVGRFDTLIIEIDGVQVKRLANEDGAGNPFTRRDPTTGVFSPGLSETVDKSETFTHTFSEPKVCGHIVEITGQSGSIANNQTGYDIGITVTLRTTQI